MLRPLPLGATTVGLGLEQRNGALAVAFGKIRMAYGVQNILSRTCLTLPPLDSFQVQGIISSQGRAAAQARHVPGYVYKSKTRYLWSCETIRLSSYNYSTTSVPNMTPFPTLSKSKSSPSVVILHFF